MLRSQRKRLLVPALASVASICLFGNSAFAARPHLFKETPDPHELAEFLFSDPVKNSSRSWSVTDEPPPTNVAALQIQFEFDSVEIKPPSVVTIERLAQALITNQAGNKPIMIEGHTDAIGPEHYNLDLSKRRAQSIREYLINIYKIAPERLFVSGLGESELLTPGSPSAAVNRRVQVRHFLLQSNTAAQNQ